MELHLQNKVVAIIGGSGGIGLAAALAFAREGCRVAVCARGTDKLNGAKMLFAQNGFSLFAQEADAKDPEAVSAFGAAVFQRFGRLDVWVNNAGCVITKPYMELTLDEWHTVMDTNLTATFWGTHVAVAYMQRTGGGVILNTASYTALIPVTQKVSYCAAKAGVVSLTKTAAAEFAPKGIRVNCIIPGLIETPIASARINSNRKALQRQISLQRFGTPEDLAGIYVFLASDAAGYITGAAYEVSGGKLCVQDPGAEWPASVKDLPRTLKKQGDTE